MADIDALCEPEVARLYRRAADLFATQTIDLTPFLEIARLLYDGPWLAERTAGLRDIVTARPEIMHPVTRDIVEVGLTRLTVDAFDAFHAQARVRRLASELFGKCDALLVPTVPFCPTIAEVAADPFGTSRPGDRPAWVGDYEVITKKEMTLLSFYNNIPAPGENNVKLVYYTGYDPSSKPYAEIKFEILRCFKNLILAKKNVQAIAVVTASGSRDYQSLSNQYSEAQILSHMEQSTLMKYKRLSLAGPMYD